MFSISMEELVRQGHMESKMSQSDLAEKAYMNQAAVSVIEKGKKELTGTEVINLSIEFNKPTLYFYPNWEGIKNEEDKLINLEKGLIIQVKKIRADDLKFLIAQTNAWTDLEEENT